MGRNDRRLVNPGYETLYRLYIEQRLSLRQMESLVGASVPTIRMWMREVGIASRTIAEAKRGQKPKAHTVEASVRARRKHFLPGRPIVGYKVRADGYIDVWIPETQSYRREHRLIFEKALGRELTRDELVHHTNNVRDDNGLTNLAATSNADHGKHHYAEREIDPATGRFLPHPPELQTRTRRRRALSRNR